MPKVGDGTGMGSAPPEQEGLTSNSDASPNSPGESCGAGEGGKGPTPAPGGSRTSPLKGGK